MRPLVSCFCRLLIIAGLGGGLAFSACADEPLDRWVWRNPLPQGNVLSSVTWADGRFVAVGMAGAALTSADGAQWEVRSTGVTNDLYKVAYGLDHYWAVGERGILLTSPDGVQWTARASGTTNRLYAIACLNNRLLVVGSKGTLGASPDGDAWTWINAGESNAFLSVAWGNGLYVAVGRTNTPWSSGGVIYSSPDAVNWTMRSQEVTVLPILGFVAYGNGVFVARGQNNALAVSGNGINWTNLTGYMKPPFMTEAMDFLGSQFVALDSGGTAFVSTNGSNWNNTVGTAFLNIPHGLAWNNQTYVMVGGTVSGAIATGTNQNIFWHWTQRQSGFTEDVYEVINDGTRLLGVGPVGKLFASADGRNWTLGNIGTNVYFNSLACASGRYVAVGRDGWIMTSTNGAQWTPAPSGTSNRLESVRFTNGRFVAVGWPATVLSSGDGLSWTNHSPTVSATTFRSVIWAHGRYLVAANRGRVYASPDLATWTECVAHTNNSTGLNDLAVGNGLVVVVGQSGVLATSTNGLNWRVQTSPTTNGLVRVTFASGLFLATGDGGTILTSPNGTNWTRRVPPTTSTLYSATALDGRWVVVGENGCVLQSDPLAQFGWRRSGALELSLAGQPGLTARLERSLALGATADWQPVMSFTLSNTPAVWTAQPGADACGFYRAVLGPIMTP